MPTLRTLIQHCARSFSQCNEARKGNRRHRSERRNKIFTDDIVYIENHKDSIEKTPRTSEFNKVVGCKIGVQKSILFLYTSNDYVDTKIKNVRPFTIAF